MVKAGERLVPMPETVLTRLVARMGPLDREFLVLFCLDAEGRALCSRVLGGEEAGSLNTGFRTLIALALACGAHSLLIVHNHPSGDARPSSADVRSTLRLQALARPLELNLFDHVVVSRRAAFSMRQAGLLNRNI
jgi:DNA repair protein RadC